MSESTDETEEKLYIDKTDLDIMRETFEKHQENITINLKVLDIGIDYLYRYIKILEELNDKKEIIIKEATKILQNAPDILTKNHNKLREVVIANKTAWAVLTQGKYPESKKK